MAPKSKTVSVSKRPSAEQIQDSKRWRAFLSASGTPFLSLSYEWLEFFDAQSNIESASNELLRLIDIAIEKQNDK